MKASANQTVGYVDAEGRIKKAKITQVIGDDLVILDHSEKGDGSHTAQAHFNDDKKTPNTWHQLEVGSSSSTPAEPGAAARKQPVGAAA